MKRSMKWFLLAVLTVALSGVLMTSSYADSTDSGIVKVQSAYSVAETGDRFEAVLNEQGLTQFARIDHAAGAESVDLELRPTQVIIFGNPQVGTPLMQCNQQAAIDLPQKALIWEDETGQVWIGYNDPDYLMTRHNLSECAALIERIKMVLSNLVSAAAQP